MSRTRSYRRHHRERMLAKARIVQKKFWWWDLHTEDDLHQAASRLADNLAVCSCQMCRNIRSIQWYTTWDKLTQAEKKAYLSYKEQIVDFYNEVEDNPLK